MARASLTYLSISISKRETQGELLTGHIELINDWQSLSCVVGLGDTLHRHNLVAHGDDPEKGRAAALALGDDWLAREGQVLQALAVPWRLMRHDDMLALEAYPVVRARLPEVVSADADLAGALALDIDGFAQRAGRRGEEGFCAASAAYILEELAADIAYAQIQPYTYVYPGRPLNIYVAVQQAAGRLSPELRGLERCTFLQTRVRNGRIKIVR